MTTPCATSIAHRSIATSTLAGWENPGVQLPACVSSVTTVVQGCRTPGAVERLPDGVTERLDSLLDVLPEEILHPMWAHMSLRMTDWAIRHFPPGEVDRWLDLAEQRIG